MPELLNNTLETELLEGFMHQLDREETEDKLSQLFAQTVVDMLTVQPDGRAFYSDILWALLLEKCLLLLQQVKLFPGSITRLIVAHRQPLRGCTKLYFCLCFSPFFPFRAFHPHETEGIPQEEAASLSQQGVLGGQTQLQEPHTAWGSWQWERNEPILVFKGNVLLCYRRKEVWVINGFFNHQQLLSVTLCWTISAWHLSTPPWCLLVRLPHLLSHQHPPQPSLLAWYS